MRTDQDAVPGTPGEPGPSGGPDEDRLRTALRDAATGVRPSPWPGGAVLRRARRRQRVRRTALALSAVAVVAAGGLGVVATRHRDAPGPVPVAGPPSAPATATAHSPVASPTPAWPAVRVLRPGQIIGVGQDTRLRLEPDRRCLSVPGAPGGWNCKSVTDGNQAAGTVGLQSQGDGSGTLYTPLYVGGGTVARMSVTVRGRVYPLRVARLAGRPGFATGFGRAPSAGLGAADVTVSVYDASGRVLASFP